MGEEIKMKTPQRPKEYINNRIVFHGYEFYIDDRAYITASESSRFIDLVSNEIEKDAFVFDIGSGSATLACCLKLLRTDLQIISSDLDLQTFPVARRNITDYSLPITMVHSNYVDHIFQKPDVIIAILPHGNENLLLPSNKIRERKNEFIYYPKESLFNPKGPLHSYIELISSIRRKGWKPVLYFETGIAPDIVIIEAFKGLKIKIKRFKDTYSVTRVDL